MKPIRLEETNEEDGLCLGNYRGISRDRQKIDGKELLHFRTQPESSDLCKPKANPRQTEAFALGEKYEVQDRMFMEVAKVASIKIDVK